MLQSAVAFIARVLYSLFLSLSVDRIMLNFFSTFFFSHLVLLYAWQCNSSVEMRPGVLPHSYQMCCVFFFLNCCLPEKFKMKTHTIKTKQKKRLQFSYWSFVEKGEKESEREEKRRKVMGQIPLYEWTFRRILMFFLLLLLYCLRTSIFLFQLLFGWLVGRHWMSISIEHMQRLKDAWEEKVEEKCEALPFW